tara:strand:+ start:4467 stop:6293 length:1827 start_codon:yes stop_codon:yes gene_type:complete
MELKNLLENRNTTFVRISEAADYLGTCLRENVVVFDVIANKQKATFLSESGHLIGATYQIKEDVISLSNFEVENSEDILSDEKVDAFVQENVGSLVRALNTNKYDSAENSFSQIVEAFSYRSQINDVRGEIYKKMSRFDHKTTVRDTVEYCKLQEMQTPIYSFIKENLDEILSCTDVSNALKLSKALSTAYNKTPRLDLDELPVLENVVVEKQGKDTLYETICKQELIHKELLESKRNFASLWADNESISRLASCIYSDKEATEAAIVETIRDVPYFALASKSDIKEVITSVYEVTNPGTVSSKDIRSFVAHIFEVKKPAKAILISTLNETYGINVNNLKFIPSFSNLAKTQSVMFEALSKMTEEKKVLSEFFHEFSCFIKNKGGVEVLDISDFISEAFSDAGEEYDQWLNEHLDLEQLGDAVASEYSLREAKKKKGAMPSDVGGNQYRGDDDEYIESDDEEEGSVNNHGDDDDDDSKSKKGKDKDDEDSDDEDSDDDKPKKRSKKDDSDDSDGDQDGDGDVDDVDKKISSEKKAIFKTKKKLKEEVTTPEPQEQEAPQEETEDEAAQAGALSDNEIKDLVSDMKGLMKDLDFKALDSEVDEEEDTDV